MSKQKIQITVRMDNPWLKVWANVPEDTNVNTMVRGSYRLIGQKAGYRREEWLRPNNVFALRNLWTCRRPMVQDKTETWLVSDECVK